MKHFINLKDIPSKDLRKIIIDAKRRKYLRKKLNIPHKLSEVIKEEDLELDRLSIMALNDPSTSGNPKRLTENDMKILYQHSMSGKFF